MDTAWLLLVLSGIVAAALTGNIESAVTEALKSASAAVETVLGFMGAMCLWLGLMKIAERSGLAQVISKRLTPFLRIIFRDVPVGHPAMEAISMSVVANMLGLGSAATPLGLKAMRELSALNANRTAGSRSMCTFVCMVCSGFTLVPGAMVAIRAQMGASHPTWVVTPTIVAGLAAFIAVLTADAVFRTGWRDRQ